MEVGDRLVYDKDGLTMQNIYVHTIKDNIVNGVYGTNELREPTDVELKNFNFIKKDLGKI